jgi:hypothetical protein
MNYNTEKTLLCKLKKWINPVSVLAKREGCLSMPAFLQIQQYISDE